MGKHAYLIMAHNDFNLLKKLLCLLDYENNDIYLHIDKKAIGFSAEELTESVKKSGISYVNRVDVQWGGYSQIDCELLLLKEATKMKYDYYHLLSGADLPLKSQKYIHDFFEANYGNEYLSFDHRAKETGDFLQRIRYWHLLHNRIGRNKGFAINILKVVEKTFLKIQEILKIDRTSDSGISFYKGTNWFSITHNLAMHILSKEDFIKKYFSRSVCADEIFLHTIAMNSPFQEKIIDNSLRYIDWERGKPYTFRLEDYDEILYSDKLWARKFSSQIDEKIIDALYSHVSKVIA